MSSNKLGNSAKFSAEKSWLQSIWSNKTAYFSLFAGSCSLIGLQAIEASAKTSADDNKPAKPTAKLISAKDFACKTQTMADRLIRAKQNKSLTALPDVSALLNGGTECSNRTVIPAGTVYNDTGTTVAGTNTVNSVQAGCSNYTTNAGPDVIYELNLPALGSRTVTNSSIVLTPTSGTYDPSIYTLSTAGVGCPAGPAAAVTNCVNGADAGVGGGAETITDAELDAMPAGMYFLFIDSFYSTAAGSGPFSLAVNVDVVGTAVAPVQHVVDFNGDGKTDYSVVRNNAGQLNWLTQINGSATTQGASWGLSTDRVVSGDFDGDAKSDVAVWRPGAANVASFYILNSNGFTLNQQVFGQTGDDPTVVGDYDGDGKTDVATYRAGATAGAQSFWYYRGSLANPTGNITYTPWGSNGDFPAPGDYDGNGRADFCVQRGPSPATFYTRLSTGVNLPPVVFGTATDVIVPGDYDGDGKTDIATARNVGGALQWQWLRSSNGVTAQTTFGVSATDFITHGDYDGDGKTDVSVWRPGTGFYTLQSTNGASVYQSWGTTGDFPIANFNTH